MGRLRSNNLFFLLFLFLFSFLKAGFSSSTSEYFRELGKKYYLKGDYQSAITEFTKAVLADSSDELSQEYLKLAKEKARKEVINNYLDYLDTGKEKITSPSPAGEKEVYVQKPLERRKEKPEEKIREEQPEKKSPNVKVSGDYQLSFGVNSSDFIWKEANADKTGVPYEKNWRYLWGKERYNTFDEAIYDRLRVNLDINSEVEEGWGGFLQMVVDPWSFVGKTRVEVSSVVGNDKVKMDLKYWAGSGKTIDEVYRSELGNIVTVGEIKVIDGKTTPTTPSGLSNWFTNFNQITPTQIDRMYRFFRQCFIDYKGESFKFRFFPIAYQDQALTTDDPLVLSNKHIWWEESPWLDDYEPSRVFTRTGNPLKKGRWQRRWSFVARDSDLQRLTFLRGFSWDWDLDRLITQFTLASPMNFWDEYERVHSLAEALRIKYDFLDNHTLGFTQTTKLGITGGSFEAKNFVYSLDYAYSLDEESSFYFQTAYSTTDIDEANGIETSYEGGAYSLGFKSIKKEEEKEVYRDEVWFAYLEDDFYPALSNYRYTCLDPFWSKHIRFEEISPENQAIYLGDSINRGRYVAGLTFQRAISSDFDFLFNLRNAHQDNGKYLETVSRLETNYRVNPSLLLKTLFWYRDLPLTKAGYDPIITSDIVYSLTDYFSDRWEFVENSQVVDGKNPSVGHFSLGFKYDLTDYFSLEGIYERTNDPENFPRALLANTYVTSETINGILYDKVVPLLYNQGFFDLPPYDYYSIVKGKFILKPNQNWRIIFKGARNTNKYSAGLDDNINHLGLEVEYLPTEKINLWFQYVYSKFIDLYRQVKGEGIHYDGHHNIFIGLRYRVDENSLLDFIFGETPGYDYEYQQGEWSLSSLDTQHLFRIYYRRKF
ncbi:MAG: hypothetical protein J7K37_04885 [Candidatus Omnitrophica bacterium]|nr:hypothetical protein [Candidatus Omnitrophota bacterium]